MEKQIDKLNKNLNQALPKGKNMQELQSQDMPGIHEEALPLEIAVQISEKAKAIARQVYSFIYPETHSVDLKELRSPGILTALITLRELDEVYLRKMNLEAVK